MNKVALAQVIGALAVKSAQTMPTLQQMAEPPPRPAPPNPQELADAQALASIRSHESFVPQRYPDPKGIPTVGTGLNMDVVRPRMEKVIGPDRTGEVYAGKPITRNEDYRVVQDHMQRDLQSIRKKVPQWDDLAPGARAAIQSGYYNGPKLLGPKATQYLNNMLRAPEFKKRPAASEYLRKLRAEWAYGHKGGVDDKNPKGLAGLRRRRVEEANMMGKAYGQPDLPVPQTDAQRQQYYRQYHQQANQPGGNQQIQR